LMLKDFFVISIKNLARRKLRSWLTIIGIFIGIAAIVSLLALGEGLRIAITSQFGFLSTDVITVQAGGVQYGPPGTRVVNPLTIDDADKIADIMGVKASIPRLIRSGTLRFNKKDTTAYLVSVPDGWERKEVERIANLEASHGRLLKDGDKHRAVLGSNYVKESTFGKPVLIGQRIEILGRPFEVVGILERKGSFIVDNAVILNDEVMREMFDEPEKVDILAVIVANVDELEVVQERIERLLRKERGVKKGDDDFSVQTAKKALESLNDTLFAVQLFVYIIAGISLLVGGIGIMNTMYTAVLERTRDIGIMKSIGARNRDIFALFFIESGFLGTVGGLAGILIGAGLALGLSAAGRIALGADLIQAHFPWWLMPGALLFSFIVGSVAGIVPALQASGLRPVDALRHKR